MRITVNDSSVTIDKLTFGTCYGGRVYIDRTVYRNINSLLNTRKRINRRYGHILRLLDETTISHRRRD
jgi:hypothetical protein